MERAKQTKYNILISLLHQVVRAVYALILPRFVLSYYGSEVNGVLQSVSQLLGYTVLFECGIGGAVRAAFYKPLAHHDEEAVSDLFNSTRRFFNRLSLLYLALVVFLCFGSKLIISTELSAFYVGTIALILAIDTYFSYYFGIAHQLLMKSDQKLYIIQTIQSITLLLNLVLCIFAMKAGLGIHAVKLITASVFLFNPLSYMLYVKKHYKISKKLYSKERVLPQKRDAMVHHISYFIHRNTDIVIISAFCGVKSASVYSVYNAVILMTENILNSISEGVVAAMGNMLAKKEEKTLKSSFEIYEAVNTTLTMAIAAVTAVLILPFVSVYTQGVTDINYINPLFAYLMIAAGAMYCLRMPYHTVISSAGHYKETRLGAVGEMIINLGLSLLLVKPMGIAGVAAATLAAMTFRTFYMAWYLSKNLIFQPMIKCIKSLCINGALCAVVFFIFKNQMPAAPKSFPAFFVDALLVAIPGFLIFILVNYLFNRRLFPIKEMLKAITKKEK